jgi:5-methylcytosine-specific restriction endonuclease McrA
MVFSKRCVQCLVLKSLNDYCADIRARDGKQSCCRSCQNIRVKEYGHTERGRQARLAWEKSEKGITYFKSDTYRKIREKYLKKDSSIISMRVRALKYYRSEKGNEKSRLYRQSIEGKEVKARYKHKRRLILSNTLCDFTGKQWSEIQILQNHKCAICGVIKPLTRDHIIPVTKGGQHTKGNIQGLCRSCNSRKHNHIDKF